MRKRLKCLCCKKKKLVKIIDLGLHSFADRFVKIKDAKKNDPQYPLVVDYCKNCSFIQLRYITDPNKRYSEVDYSYTSSNSSYSRNHWNKFYKDVSKFLNNKSYKKVIEIGANDGYLTKIYKNKKYNVVAVDASRFMTQLIKKKKIKYENLIFNYFNSKKIKKKYGNQDIIIANNVFNHSDQPSSFLKGVKNIISKNGVFVFEQPYFTKSIDQRKFDQIYHEHVSYFTLKNIKNLLYLNGFKIIKVEFNNYHGGSIRTYASLINSDFKKNNLKYNIKNENKTGVNRISFYKKFNNFIRAKKIKTLKKVKKYKLKNYTISGVGAAAKANTLLTFYGLDSKKIDFITDGSKFKINKLTPKTRIKILSDNELKKYDKIACIILAWNISNLLKIKLKKINKNIKFINS
jgi:SAM-dependent methyltransferase